MNKEHVEKLADELLTLKAEEALARALRIKKEREIADVLGVPSEGSESHQFGHIKITLRQPLTRTLDQEEAARVAATQDIHPFRSEFKLDTRKFNSMAETNPTAYSAACTAIVTKPGKVAVTVEQVEVQDGV